MNLQQQINQAQNSDCYQFLMKDFDDTYSFKAHSRNSSLKSLAEEAPAPEIKNWREMTYRFQKKVDSAFPHPNRSMVYQNHYINEKISRVDEELSQNIRRRIELETKLYKNRVEIRQKENGEYFKEHNSKNEEQVQKIFVKMEKKTDKVQKLLEKSVPEMEQPYRPPKHVIENEEKSSKKQKIKYDKKSHNIIPVKKIVPNQIRVQQLLKKTTFPKLPTTNISKLQKQIFQISLNSEHSDISYLQMAINFHLGRHNKVRKYFRQIQMFKVYEPKAYWIACETEYELQGYELCIRLADICMRELSDEYLPRFLFLQARCYQKLGNYVNSVVCYNQLIKIRPRVAEFYLDRALIYDKIGYPKEAKQDYCYFSTLMPQAKQYLKERVLEQQNQIKRKQLIKALAKIS